MSWTGLSLFGFFYCIPENLTGPLHAFLISVGIHSEGDGLITMSQLFRYTGDICAAGDCNAGEGVAQLVGMKIGDAILAGKLLHVPGGTLGVHGGGAIVLGEYIASMPPPITVGEL